MSDTVTITRTGHEIGAIYEDKYWGGAYLVLGQDHTGAVEVERVVKGHAGKHYVVGDRWTHRTALDHCSRKIGYGLDQPQVPSGPLGDEERERLWEIAGVIERGVKERKLPDEANQDARYLRNLSDLGDQLPATDTRPLRGCCDTQVGNPHEPWCDVALFKRQKSAAGQQCDRLLEAVKAHKQAAGRGFELVEDERREAFEQHPESFQTERYLPLSSIKERLEALERELLDSARVCRDAATSHSETALKSAGLSAGLEYATDSIHDLAAAFSEEGS